MRKSHCYISLFRGNMNITSDPFSCRTKSTAARGKIFALRGLYLIKLFKKIEYQWAVLSIAQHYIALCGIAYFHFHHVPSNLLVTCCGTSAGIGAWFWTHRTADGWPDRHRSWNSFLDISKYLLTCLALVTEHHVYAKPLLFPNGLKTYYTHEKLKLNWVAHHEWWNSYSSCK